MRRRDLLRLAAGSALLLPWAARAQNWRDPAQHFFQPLLGDLSAELKQAGAEGKKGLMLIYEMDECPFCERLHKTALRDVAVQEYYRQHFAVFKIDILGGNPLAGFDGVEATESKFASQQKVRATPTSVFYDLAGKELVRFPGTPRDKKEFLQWGDFVVREKYRTMSFVQFRRAEEAGKP